MRKKRGKIMGKEITRTMTFGELLDECPQAGEVLAGKGLHCIGCHIGITESIEEGARAHGLSESDIDSMIDAIKVLVK
jgi:hybrid cluster-associated redox disulfide protein